MSLFVYVIILSSFKKTRNSFSKDINEARKHIQEVQQYCISYIVCLHTSGNTWW